MNTSRVLVVDDNAGNRKLLRVVLESENFSVAEASDGVEALEALESCEVDAIISDILMPRMDGYRLCHELHKQKRWENLPFIIYSATYVTDSDRKLALDMGADSFITKPASNKTIVDVLRSSIQKPVCNQAVVKEPPPELSMLRQYSERLIAKLEERGLELEDKTRELQVSETRYRLLAETAPDTIFSVDRNGVMRYINDRGALDFGLPAHEIIGKSQRELFPPAIAKLNEATLKHVATTGKSVHDLNLRPFRGVERWHETWLVPLRGVDGEIEGVMGVARDVTDRKRLEELRAHIGVSLSHELNTPLNGIIGIAELLQDGFDTMPRAEAKEMTRLLLESAERLNRVVQQNLDFAEVERILSGSARETLRCEFISDCSSFARECALEVAGKHRRESDLKMKLEAGRISIHARFLKRVLFELLDNAFKFSRAGTAVVFETRCLDDRLDIVIDDQGRGMRPDQVSAVTAFRQFERERMEQQGVGLGLYLSQRICELHRGGLEIANNSHGGLRVNARLRHSR